MVSQLLKSVAFATTAAAMAIDTTTIEKRDSYCFSVDSANNDWYYQMAGGPWGNAGGTFGSTNGQICVPISGPGVAGGAMFIGPFENPGAGSTKFECNFTSAGTAYCDISVVDGYSLSMTCGAGGQGGPVFGGSGDFFEQGNACPDSQGANCINTQGYSDSQSDVDPFFQYGLQGNNKYCIWHNCEIFTFPIDTPMGCYITGF